MALSMDALFKTLNDFFLSRFGSSDSRSVVFRFDKFGSKMSQDDFRANPLDPSSPFSAAVAREKISDFANRLPAEVGDGTSVNFLADTIDAIYEEVLLKPAQPHLPAGTDTHHREALIQAFSSMKADALNLLENAEMTSVSGVPLGYHLTDFTPADWYDLASNEVWTSHSFTVRGEDQPSSTPSVEWRELPSDQRLEELVRNLPSVRDHRTSPRVRDHRGQRGEDSLQLLRRRGLVQFDVLDRLRFKEDLLADAPTVEVTTSEVQLSFEYCLVNLNQRWLNTSFLNADNWVIPGKEQGSANQSGRPGSLTLLPLAFLAVRKLSIQASWSDADRQALTNAMSWGPFEVMPSVGSGDVAQPGLQIVGWVLQKLPPLPPQSSGGTPPLPEDGGSSPRTYRVQAGDTLRKIATYFYGDPEKYGVIQRANNIARPDQIFVGQVLKVPGSPDVGGSSPRTYRVQAGDTLRKIAMHFYGDPEKYGVIQRANNIARPDQIFVGQVLKVP
ncbi:LysM peptidoglycan-binding domain-containing protein [Geodermatophilus sp. SYSU D00867]